MDKLLQALIDKLSRLVSAVSHELSAFEQRRNNTEYKHLQVQLRKFPKTVEGFLNT